MSTRGIWEGRRARGDNQRARAQNPRALGVAPRQLGLAPRQQWARSSGREAERRWPEQLRHYHDTKPPCTTCDTGLEADCPTCHGEGYLSWLESSGPYCPACNDTGWEEAPGRTVQPCRQCGWWRRAPGAPAPNHPLGRPDRPDWRGPSTSPTPACTRCHDSGWRRVRVSRRRRIHDDEIDVDRWVRCSCT